MSKNTDLGSLVNYIKGQVTGRLNAPAYTSATAFTGTIAGYLGFDTSGNILTSASIGISGSGTTNYVPKFTGSTALGNSLIYDDGSLVGINTTSPSEALTVKKTAGTACYISAYNGTTSIFTGVDTGGLPRIFVGSTNPISFWTNSLESMRIQASGNVSIGNTNNTYKLDVTGDVNISGTYRVNGTAIGSGVTGSGSTNYLPLWTSTTVLGNSIIYNNAGNLGINSTTNGYTLNAIRSASTQFTQSYKGAGSLMQVMSRFMQDETSNKGIAIGYLNTGNVSGIWSTNTGALMLGVWTTAVYKTKLYLTEDNVAVDIPTSGGGLTSGMLWNDGGTVKIIT